MTETLKELNQQAIRDGLLLPDGQPQRKDFNPILGKPLSFREQKAYSLIHNRCRPTTTEELAREMYPDYFKAGLGYQAKEAIWNLINERLKKKLGEMAIISYRRIGYLSRRSLIMSDVEERHKLPRG